MSVPWVPSLEQVAGHIPARTRATTHPGANNEDALPKGTFTAETQPTDEVAGRFIAAAVAQVAGRVGTVPSTPTYLVGLATAAAALRAAADIELAYGSDRDADRDANKDAVRDIDTQIYERLDARAGKALADLVDAIGQGGGGPSGQLLPQWSMPEPPAWGDTDL
ncbi:hypothetical protein OIE13_05980 [Streptosporangium sp. NBC_01810]|uniref:hypothetical protein n=1 Tax=Streptosporangium sp. NBC_01810 TaxID=2975951 RepID=UPI002DDB9A8E|nr:hypothetical protein [Streptosporangium sp. NBC_01810]WSA27422.1 hypothetical protein OIE13_05980 [Streptosporangium sp. NBC_01810]